MWNSDNLWPEIENLAPASSYNGTKNEIHVLVVEHESEGLLNTAKMLELCHYKVTLVEFASAAVSMIEKVTFDVVIANLHSPDFHGFKLLEEAVRIGLPIAVMSNDDNSYMAMRALESGAFLYVKKPLTLEILKCLWQHALREKRRMMRAKDKFNPTPDNGQFGVDVEDDADTLESMVMMITKNKEKLKNKSPEEKFDTNHQNRQLANNSNNNSNVRRKMCTEWTQELHAKFMAAVEELGEGRCFPKEILQIMNVPGLTRMQVASHLQKCRNDNWRSPFERRFTQLVSVNPNKPMHRPKRFGLKPVLKTLSNLADDSHSHRPDRGSKPQSENVIPNNGIFNHHYEPMGPDPLVPHLTPNSTNYGHSAADDRFQDDLDTFIHNFWGLPNGPGLHHPITYIDQNSGGPSMERSNSHWSSDLSNLENI